MQTTAQLREVLAEAEERETRAALQTTGGNVTRAALLLGISKPTIYRRMQRFGIKRSVEIA